MAEGDGDDPKENYHSWESSYFDICQHFLSM